LPTAYHESTTPYDDFDDIAEENEDEDEFDGHNAFEETTDTNTDIIEAINPNVQVLRFFSKFILMLCSGIICTYHFLSFKIPRPKINKHGKSALFQ
jgi:hypothetical protein